MARKVRFFHDQVEKAGLTAGIRPLLDKALDMDELEVRVFVCVFVCWSGRRERQSRGRAFFGRGAAAGRRRHPPFIQQTPSPSSLTKKT
jgi:hypothetical protein